MNSEGGSGEGGKAGRFTTLWTGLWLSRMCSAVMD